MRNFRNKIFLLFVLVALSFPLFSFADTYNQRLNFYIDSNYDIENRDKIEGILKYISIKGYFYVEYEWWQKLNDQQKQDTLKELSDLGKEFDQKIYPVLTSVYGREWSPGIDKDRRVTVFLHQMKKSVGGYHRTIDEYYKLQFPTSNQREMVYLNLDYLGKERLKSFLAHEFTHLIVFNQKVKLFKTDQEEIWLNEGYADYAPTLLGYDDDFSQDSNLYNRVREFLMSPSDSLTEWKNNAQDYGTVNLFIQYLVDHYGIKILEDALHSKKIGLDSLNYALEKNGYNVTVRDIFVNWIITLTLNDCSAGKDYCYLNKNLQNLRVTPALIFLPTTQESKISLVYSVKDWSAKWLKIIGGNQGLEVEIKNIDVPELWLPYIIRKNNSGISINIAKIKESSFKIDLPEFAKENVSLIMMPMSMHKDQGFGSDEPSFSFSVEINSIQENSNPVQKPINKMTVSELQEKIQELRVKISQLQNLLIQLMKEKSQENCRQITENLYYGMRNNLQVRCLQEFLKSQGKDIYPEGLVTGNFLELTKQAVIRFQEKYRKEILEPLGLEHGTGFVGPKTREKINQLLTENY